VVSGAISVVPSGGRQQGRWTESQGKAPPTRSSGLCSAANERLPPSLFSSLSASRPDRALPARSHPASLSPLFPLSALVPRPSQLLRDTLSSSSTRKSNRTPGPRPSSRCCSTPSLESSTTFTLLDSPSNVRTGTSSFVCTSCSCSPKTTTGSRSQTKVLAPGLGLVALCALIGG
jgi:hypothetical protein